MPFNRTLFFDMVRENPFGGALSEEQVSGMEYILDVFDGYAPKDTDLRWLAYTMGTAKHETASTMQPIEEYGYGKGMEYGEEDPETGQTYYGRGLIMITWRENYARADKELHFEGDDSCEYHADNALDPPKSAAIIFKGMYEGWFRADSKGNHNFARYFNNSVNDGYGAREIVNGDKHIVPSWSGGVSIGNLIKGYHNDFLAALEASWIDAPVAPPTPTLETVTYSITITGPKGLTQIEIEELEDF